ncbi:hypothetical protein C8Q70DRAFT_265916 [Cubamyces menziesii]|nr:hypothetical protein C8Q70DRAFT_265916 [Cubamyces menziesii]
MDALHVALIPIPLIAPAALWANSAVTLPPRTRNCQSIALFTMYRKCPLFHRPTSTARPSHLLVLHIHGFVVPLPLLCRIIESWCCHYIRFHRVHLPLPPPLFLKSLVGISMIRQILFLHACVRSLNIVTCPHRIHLTAYVPVVHIALNYHAVQSLKSALRHAHSNS